MKRPLPCLHYVEADLGPGEFGNIQSAHDTPVPWLSRADRAELVALDARLAAEDRMDGYAS